MEPKIVGKAQVTIVESEDFKNISLEELNKGIQVFKEAGGYENGISDGHHTFDELYEFRLMYNAALFNEWADNFEYDRRMEEWELSPKYDVHKSWKHHDGEDCFGGGWFIVVAMLPTGQITNHYKAEHFDLFKIPEESKAKYEWDGHIPQDVLNRLKAL